MAKQRGVRSQKASFADIAKLLRDYVWIPELPKRVGLAATRILIARGVLHEQKGHVELVGHPGATLEYPPDARSVLYHAIISHALKNQEVAFLCGFIRGSGASGGGGTEHGGITSDSLDHEPGQDVHEADRLEWHRETLVKGIGGDRQDAEVLVDHQIKSLRLGRYRASEQSTRVDSTDEKQDDDIDVELDVEERKLRWRGSTIPLRTRQRVELLKLLSDSPGEWTSSTVIDRALDMDSQTVVKRLRKTLQDRFPELADLITSERGEGYKVNPNFTIRVLHESAE